MTRTKTIAASLAISCVLLTATAKARADCAGDCIGDLCSARDSTIVTGPLVVMGGELRVEIRTVVRQGPGAVVAVGSQIAAGYTDSPQMYAGNEAMVITTLTGAPQMYARWFPIDGNGHVHCRGYLPDPAPGGGSTPAEVASLSVMDALACRRGFEAAGYATNDCGGAGCMSGCGGEEASAWLGSPAMLAVGLLIRRRRRSCEG